MVLKSDSLRKVYASLPRRATVIDVSARDGLQSRAEILTPPQKALWVKSLLAAGVDEVEVGAFVHPGKLPQMAGTDKVLSLLDDSELGRAWVLVPNMRGLDAAIDAGARNVVVLASTTETHSMDNLGRPIAGVLDDLAPMAEYAAKAKVNARASLSMAWIDPTEGKVPTGVAGEICHRFFEMGYAQITLCDTYGGASPIEVTELLDYIGDFYAPGNVGLHLHDTFGTASANTFAALAAGVTRFDASINGIGGCPFAPGARGNMDTAHLIHLLDGLGVETSVDLSSLNDAAGKCMALLNSN